VGEKRRLERTVLSGRQRKRRRPRSTLMRGQVQ
jgi:hypothetical protein